MAYTIVWTPSAEEDLKEIVDYLYENWSLEIADKFVDNTFKKVDLLKNTPYIGKTSQKLTFVRRILLSKHNGLFYRIMGNEVVILSILTLNQNPDNIPY